MSTFPVPGSQKFRLPLGLLVFAACLSSAVQSGTADAGLPISEPHNEFPLKPVPLEAIATTHDTMFALSPDGTALATLSDAGPQWRIRVSNPAVNADQGTELKELAAPSVAWSPDSRMLAYLEDDDRPALRLWDRNTATSRAVPGVAVARRSEIVWMPDNRRILVQILPQGVKEIPPPKAEGNAFGNWLSNWRPEFAAHAHDAPGVIVQHSPAPLTAASPDAQSSGFTPINPASCPDHISACPLVLIDTETGRAMQLADDARVTGFQASPAGREIFVTELTGTVSGQFRFRLEVVTASTGARRVVAEQISIPFPQVTWSPDGNHLAVLETGQAIDQLSVISSTSGVLKRRFHLANDTFTVGRGVTGLSARHNPLWSADGRYLYQVSDAGALWKMDVSSGQVMRVFARADRNLVNPVIAQNSYFVGDSLRLFYQNNTGGQSSGVAEIDLKTGSLLSDEPMEGDASLVTASGSGKRAVYALASAARSTQYIFQDWGQNLRSVVGSVGADVPSYSLGELRTIHYLGKNGQSLGASLLLPAGWNGHIKPPLVMFVYGGEMGSQLHEVLGWSQIPEFNSQVLVSRGYAVCFPDIPMGFGRPKFDISEAVNAATGAVIDQGYADSDRLAIMGQSFGSYTTMAALSGTDRFKAAIVTGTHWPDLISTYYDTRQGMADSSSPQGAVSGQLRMGVTPWADRQRWLDNSYFWDLPRISTPIMILQGDTDLWYQSADALFLTLKELHKTAEYRLYEGENHTIDQPKNVIDAWNARLNFLAEHLNLRLDPNGAIVYHDGKALGRK